MRLAPVLALCVALTGCVEGGTGAGAVRAVTVMDGAFAVQAPRGYCVDLSASRASRGFVVMAGCALLTSFGFLPSADALITVQIGPDSSAIVSGSENDLVALLQSSAGKNLLSDVGDGSGVTVGTVSHADGLVMVQFTDTAPPLRMGLESSQWRAFLDLNGRLVTIGLRGYDRAPMDQTAGTRLLQRTIDALRAANPAQPT